MTAEESAAWCAVIKAGTPALMMLAAGILVGWLAWLILRKED
jgi:hypothetical protein